MPRSEGHGEVTRKRILQAATALLARKGYSCATFEEIAKTGRVSKGAVQYHFPKLTKLFVEIHDRCLSAAFDQWHRWLMDTPGSSKDRLELAIGKYLDWSSSDEYLALLEIQLAARGNRDLLKPLTQSRRRHMAKRAQTIQIEAKSIVPDAENNGLTAFSQILVRVEWAARSTAIDRLLSAAAPPIDGKRDLRDIILNGADARELRAIMLDGLLGGLEERSGRKDARKTALAS